MPWCLRRTQPLKPVLNRRGFGLSGDYCSYLQRRHPLSQQSKSLERGVCIAKFPHTRNKLLKVVNWVYRTPLCNCYEYSWVITQLGSILASCVCRESL